LKNHGCQYSFDVYLQAVSQKLLDIHVYYVYYIYLYSQILEILRFDFKYGHQKFKEHVDANTA